MSPRWFTAPRFARAASASCLMVTLLLAGNALGHDARIDDQVRRLKAMHQEILLGGAGRRIDAMRALARRRPRDIARALRSHPPRDTREALGPQGRSGIPFGLAATRDAGPLPGNVQVSEPSQLFATQSEVSIAANGLYRVAAWNDGGTSGGTTNGINYATSVDAGVTWIQGGPLPVNGSVLVWTSDPTVVADLRRGTFVLSGLVIAQGPLNGIGAIRGRFGPGGFAWEVPRVARGTRDTFPDKSWIAADSVGGNLYLSYTSFFRRQMKNSDQLEIQRSTDGGVSWEPRTKLSPDAEDGLVQGSRPIVGPEGDLHVVWKTIDTTAAAGGLDAIRIRSSRDGGQTYEDPVTVAGVYTNFCSGAPGFDRGSGLGFPSIAVDRTRGPHRGRLYVSWEESLDFYDDPVGTGGVEVEAEPNDVPLTATPFTLGETVHAQISPGQDTDWYRFHGEEGQTAIVYLDSLESRLDVALRMWCADARTRLAYSAPLTARARALVVTLPRRGDFYVTVSPYNDSTGFYRLSTGLAARGGERGRDQRDLFVSYSDDAIHWSVPVRPNADPPLFDDWLPELAVGADGHPYLAWYDWRDGDPQNCGAASNVMLARSDDDGVTWREIGSVTEVPTLWSAVGSNLVPNMGDYITLVADERGIQPAWADGRNGDPDVFTAFWPLPESARDIQPSGSEVQPDGVLVRWTSPDQRPIAATVYRRVSGGPDVALAEVTSGDAGVIETFDADVKPGFRYHYQLGVRTSGGEERVGPQSVDVPDRSLTSLAIEQLRPNPSQGPLVVQFRRPDPSPARLELIDIGGRRLWSMELGAEYGARGIVDVGRQVRLDAGLYVVRLVQGGQAVGAKAVIFR